MNSDENAPKEGQELPVAEIGRPHGIKGEIKVYPYSGNPENFKSYRKLIVHPLGEGTAKSYELLSCRIQGPAAVIKLAGVDTRSQADLLTGCQVLVERQEIPELDDDEFYWDDLQGMTVVTAQGRQLGTVSRLMATGAHDILVVVDRGREYLIPALDEFVVAIDAETGTITVDLPEGLLEIND
ncbi:MAG: ribosome maturation factor RimM [Proteobacteria bacterium]|nr:ribosome maturation factor RimM [Pseudomonadota bacterium]MBU4297403.1 ribosome maturation factor RimM [Pseudomonadota bacterium]MCG2748747.1 ribosome maturation factor RimM [Desulfobulbaceae bacterium]